MKRLMAIAALLCVCGPVHAAEWVRMSTIDINQHWYDRSKIFVEGDLVTYWRRVTFRSPQRSKAGMASSAMYHERVDCRSHMHTTLGYLLYSKDQSVLDNVNTPEAAPEAIVPETVGDQFEKLMCSLAPQIAIEQKAVASTMPRTRGELRDEIDFLEARLRMLREQLDLLGKSPPPAAAHPDAEAR